MTTLVVADLHLTDNPRDDYRFAALTTIRMLCHKHKVENVLILGDLTEEKDRHAAELVNRTVDEIDRIADVVEKVIITKGNHDYIVADSPFFGFLARIPGVVYFSYPRSLILRPLGNCLFLPHTRDYVADWKELVFEDYDWIFAHNTFDGADVGHGKRMGGIPPDIFGKSRVISGDVHVPQRVGTVTYVGAPYTIDFGDSYEPRVLLIKNDKVESLPVVGPQKVLVDIAEDELDIYIDASKGDIVKMRIHIDADRVAHWAEIRAKARAGCEKLGLIVHSIQPVVHHNEGSKAAKRKIRAAKSDDDVLRSFAKLRDVDDKTMAVGLDLMQEG